MVIVNLVYRSQQEDYFWTYSGIFLMLSLQRYARKYMFQTILILQNSETPDYNNHQIE